MLLRKNAGFPSFVTEKTLLANNTPIDKSSTSMFETICGKKFGGPTVLAEFLGVTVGAVSHAVSEAKNRGRLYFECGKPSKKIIYFKKTEIDPIILSSSDSDQGDNSTQISLISSTRKSESATKHTNSSKVKEAGMSTANTKKVHFTENIVENNHTNNHNRECKKRKGILFVTEDTSHRCQMKPRFSYCVKYMAGMQVHTHLQAASSKLFPSKNLILLDPSQATQMIGYIDLGKTKSEFFGCHKSTTLLFDVAETWMLHSSCTYGSIQRFRNAVSQKTLADFGTPVYKSVLWVKDALCEESRMYCDADDCLQFILSDYARQGFYNLMFEDEMKTMPSSTLSRTRKCTHNSVTNEEQTDENTRIEQKNVHLKTTNDTYPTVDLASAKEELPPMHTEKIIGEKESFIVDAMSTQNETNPGLRGCDVRKCPASVFDTYSVDKATSCNSSENRYLQTCLELATQLEGQMRTRVAAFSRCSEIDLTLMKTEQAAHALRNITTLLIDANKLLYLEAQ